MGRTVFCVRYHRGADTSGNLIKVFVTPEGSGRGANGNLRTVTGVWSRGGGLVGSAGRRGKKSKFLSSNDHEFKPRGSSPVRCTCVLFGITKFKAVSKSQKPRKVAVCFSEAVNCQHIHLRKNLS